MITVTVEHFDATGSSLRLVTLDIESGEIGSDIPTDQTFKAGTVVRGTMTLVLDRKADKTQVSAVQNVLVNGVDVLNRVLK